MASKKREGTRMNMLSFLLAGGSPWSVPAVADGWYAWAHQSAQHTWEILRKSMLYWCSISSGFWVYMLSIWAVIISSCYWLMLISSCSGWWCSKSSHTLSHGLGKLCITLGYSRCLSLLNKVATATSSQTT